MDRSFLAVVLVIVSHALVAGTPTLESSTSGVSTSVGQTASLSCTVTDGAEVSWWYLDHTVQLSYGRLVITDDSRISILTPEGGEEWTLQISNVQMSDAGHYKCELLDQSSFQTQSLTVTGGTAPTIPDDIPPANFTDCCIAESVSSLCLPACYPQGVDVDGFDTAWCAADLPALLKCGSDGRNHVACCRERYVPDVCLGYCVNDPPLVVTPEHAACIYQTTSITACFEEGQVSLPGPPTQVKSHILSQSSVRVRWEPPEENANLTTGYRVHYQDTDVGNYYNSSGLVGDNMTWYDITGLQTGRQYAIYVVTIGDHGSSLPSYIIEINLASVPGPAGQGSGLFRSGLIRDCCIRTGVSEECVPLLCGVTASYIPDDAKLGCFTELDLYYNCLALQGDHSECCRDVGVPERCWGICAGVTPTQSDQLSCSDLPYRTMIGSCIEQGAAVLPGPPSELYILSVTENSVTIAWDPPVYGPDRVVTYQIIYWTEGALRSMVMVNAPSTTVTIPNLNPSTHYTVEAISNGVNGSSLASEQLIFLTYYSQDVAHPTMTTAAPATPAPPHDIQACCNASGMSASCAAFCHYDTGLASVSPEVLLCAQHAGTFFACAAGGKNHTGCCLDRGVENLCLELCDLTQEESANFTFENDYIFCLSQTETILQCLEEGQAVIPTHPENFYVHDLSTHTVTLQWSEPSYVPDPPGLSTYLLQYRPTHMAQAWTTEDVGLKLSYILQNLEPFTEYEIQVLAANINGSSLPSPRLTVLTLPVTPHDPYLPGVNFTTPTNVSTCCSSSNVSSECMPACTGTDVVHTHDCAVHLPSIIECAADGRNHQPCCEQRNVPTTCMGYCNGGPNPVHLPHVLCVQFMLEILTCVHEGHVLLPSWPQDLHVSDTTPWQLTYEWSPPASNGNNVTYNLVVTEQNTGDMMVRENVTSPFVLQDLQAYSYYDAFLVAVNLHGASQSTPILHARTLEAGPPHVTVSQRPPNFLSVADNATLTCQAFGEPMPNIIYWLDPTGLRTNGSVLNITRIGRYQGGKYTCVARNIYGEMDYDMLYVKVQFAPIIQPSQPNMTVPSGWGLFAVLTFLIHGYPEPDSIQWRKDHVPLNISASGGRLVTFVSDRESENLLEATLVVQGVEEEDYATYTCVATNVWGRSTANIVLTSSTDGSPLTPIQPAPAVPNVTACCQERSLPADCMPACTFDVDLTVLISLPNPFECLVEIDTFAECAADGRDHRPCCANASVPTNCLAFCAGLVRSGPLDAGQFACAEHIETIIDCMEEGHAVLPGSPQNIRGHVNADQYVIVEWDPPLIHPETVQGYSVRWNIGDGIYTGRDSSLIQGNITMGNQTTATITAILPNMTYQIFVRAFNHHGTSLPGNVIHITTYDQNVSNPTSLGWETMQATSVKLTWRAPAQHAGGVQGYIVYYKEGNSDTYKQIATNSTAVQFTLEGLQPVTNYTIYVVGVTSVSETMTSNKISVTTLGTPETGSLTSSDSEPIVIGVIVGLIVVIILATVIGIVLLSRNRRKDRDSSDESPVTFENPGYVTLHNDNAGSMRSTSLSTKSKSTSEDKPKVELPHTPGEITM